MPAKFGVTKKDRIGKLTSISATAYTALSIALRGNNYAKVIFHAYAATPPMGESC